MPSNALFSSCSVWLQPVWLKLTKKVQAPNHQDSKGFFWLLECKTVSLYLSKIWRKPLLNKSTMCIRSCGIFLKILVVPMPVILLPWKHTSGSEKDCGILRYEPAHPLQWFTVFTFCSCHSKFWCYLCNRVGPRVTEVVLKWIQSTSSSSSKSLLSFHSEIGLQLWLQWGGPLS